MTDLDMVVMWLCHFPTLHNNVIFPLGGNMMVGHDDDDDDDDYHDHGDDDLVVKRGEKESPVGEQV